MSDQAGARPTRMRERLKKSVSDVVRPRVGEDLWDRLRDPLDRDPRRQANRERRRESELIIADPSKAASRELSELAQRFRTDKFGHHYYTQHYARHFNHLRYREFTLLEIGIGGYAQSKEGGASLRTWQEYFPSAHVIGLDIEDKSFVAAPRVRVYQGDQTDPEILQQIVDDAGVIDVVIDDGSHRPEHIRETFAYLFPRLAADGFYVIEDTQTSYWPNWGGSESLNDPATTMALVKDLLDGLNYEEFTDDDYVATYADKHVIGVHAYHNLVFIEKGTNCEGSPGEVRREALDSVPSGRPFGSPAEQRRPYSVPSGPR